MISRPGIVGGMFGLDAMLQAVNSPPPFINSDSVLLVNARSGIQLLVERLNPARVWMPSYLCGTMLEGIRQTPVCFYGVDGSLQATKCEAFKEGELVVVIDYFGFAAEAELITHAKRR